MDRETEITQWADGTLNGEALSSFEAAMAQDPQLRSEAEATREIHQTLTASLPRELSIPNASAFNSGILEAIENEKITPFSQPLATKTSRLPWVISAAACIAATFSLLPRHTEETTPTTTNHTYTPDPSINAKVYIDENAGATVILLEGIESIPDEREIAPKTLISHTLPGHPGNRAFFAAHDTHLQQPIMILTHAIGGTVHIKDVH